MEWDPPGNIDPLGDIERVLRIQHCWIIQALSDEDIDRIIDEKMEKSAVVSNRIIRQFKLNIPEVVINVE